MTEQHRHEGAEDTWQGGREPLPSDQGDQWERELISRLAMSAVREQRRSRRWGIFFRASFLLWLVAVTVAYLSDLGGTKLPSGEHTALVKLDGLIADGLEAGADNVITALRDAFEDENTAGVVLRINSPGGSPVQAGQINDEIRRLRKKYPDIPLYAVIDDLCASGGYYVAVAADRIYADKASIVGSIGVRMDGFGFVDALDKLGVERRVLTAGENKAFMDPFLPLRPEEREHAQALLDDIHQQFIQVVKDGRAGRLKEDDKLFSGLMWTGQQAVEIGLVDELASVGQVAREVIGAERIVDFTHKPDLFERLADRIGVALGRGLGSVLAGATLLR
jgi:protease-4